MLRIGLALALLGCGASSSSSTSSTSTVAAASPTAALEVARAYFDALEGTDADAAAALFETESSVFEGGSDEGDFGHYREHHLGPELDAVRSFEITAADPTSTASNDGSMVLVTWPITYDIELAERQIQSQAVVTFVLRQTENGLRIHHLHWSYRPRRTPADDPSSHER